MSMAICCVGSAMFAAGGLAPGVLDYQSDALWPSAPIFDAEPFYQPVGMGERVWRLTAFCRPHIMPGAAAYGAMRGLHENRSVIPFIRLGANYVGDMMALVFVRRIGRMEERWAPDNRPYRQAFDFELVQAGNMGIGGF